MHGKLVLRANEQGQESAGQLMLKKLLRNSVNKRRKVKEYMRKGKGGKFQLHKFKKTATIASTEMLALKQAAMHRINDRLAKKLRGGHNVARLIAEGQQVKRERVMIAPNLGQP